MKRKVYEVIPIEENGEVIIGLWAAGTLPNGQEAPDKFLSIFKEPILTDLQEFKTEFEKGTLETDPELDVEPLREKLHQKGILRLRNTLGIAEPTYDTETAYQVITAAWNHDYIGQRRDSYSFYMDDLTEILKINLAEGYKIFNKLEDDQRVGMNGAIIIPFAEQEAAFARLEKSTGHKKIDITDSRTWYCKACNTFGDEFMEPTDYPCH